MRKLSREFTIPSTIFEGNKFFFLCNKYGFLRYVLQCQENLQPVPLNTQLQIKQPFWFILLGQHSIAPRIHEDYNVNIFRDLDADFSTLGFGEDWDWFDMVQKGVGMPLCAHSYTLSESLWKTFSAWENGLSFIRIFSQQTVEYIEYFCQNQHMLVHNNLILEVSREVLSPRLNPQTKGR